MPPVVAAVGAIVSVATASFIGTALTIGTLGLLGRALQPKAKGPVRVPVPVEYTGTLESRRILYGKNRVGGMNCLPAIVTGSNGEYLHQVLAIAGTEINAITSVWFDDTEITSGQIGSDGTLTGGTYSGKASIRRYLGTSTQVVDDILATAIPQWDSTHRGVGIAYAALRFTYDTNLYKNGKPEVAFTAEGRKVYDPRLDSSPGADPTNASYIAYTTNPALILADYLRLDLGVGAAATRIDWALVVTAANICDENVLIPPASPTTTQDRYTCNVVLDDLEDWQGNIATIAKAMNGVCYFRGGKWRMYAGAWTSNAFALTESDFVGGVSISTAYSRKGGNYYNAVRGFYIDPARGGLPGEFSPVFNTTYESADGERIYTDVELAACNNDYEAQRWAILHNRQGRRQRVVTAEFSLAAYKINPYETGTVTIGEVGWTNQQVRCLGWRFRPDPVVELTLIEAASSDFTDPGVSDYGEPGTVTTPTSADFKPGAPGNFTATGQLNAILLRWERPANAPAGVLYQVFEYTSNSPFSSASQVGADTADTQMVLPKLDTTERYYWVRAKVPATGNVGSTTPSTNGLPGKASAISAALSGSVSPGSATASGVSSSQTTGSVTAAGIAGTSPYTYAWAFTSGGTGITITSTTAASTTFSSTGLAIGETRTGTATCTITDSAAATYTVSVSVTISRTSGITLNSKSVSHIVPSPTDATASYQLASTRDVVISPGSTSDDWADAALTASDFECRATIVSGSVSTGTTGSWLGLGTSRTWTRTRTSNVEGDDIVVLTVEIRDVATSTVQATATITLTASVYT